MYKRCIALVLLALSYSVGLGTHVQGQQSSNDAGRKVVRKVQPEYPSDARRMNLGGTVKLVAMVSSNGSVKKVEPVGGSPLLVRAAESAVSQWKYEVGSECKETIEIHFNP